MSRDHHLGPDEPHEAHEPISLAEAILRITRTPFGAAALAALFCLALLLPFADVDPARGVTVSNSPFSDEGANIVNARNIVMLGTWATDEWNLHLLNGPFSLAEATVFSLLGIGLVQARLVSIVVVAISAGLLAGGISRSVGGIPAAIAALAYSTSALTLFYGRLAYVEPMAGLFLLVGFLTLSRLGAGHTGRAGGIAGLAFAAAIATKAVVLPGVVVALAVVCLAAPRYRPARSWLAGAAVGLALAAATWWWLIWLPHAKEVVVILDAYPRVLVDLSSRGISRALGYLSGGGDATIWWSLPILTVGVLGAAALVSRRSESSISSLILPVASTGAVLAALISFALVGYQPNRYFVPYLPIAALLIPLAASRIRASAPSMRTLLAIVLVLWLTAPGLLAYATWMAHGTRILPSVGDQAVRAIPAGAVVAGEYAPVVALRAPVTTIVVCCGAHVVNGGDLYHERGVRYVVTGADPPGWAPAPPDVMAAARPLFCFPWGEPTATSCLLQLP